MSLDWAGRLLSALMVLVVLVACADDDSDRQFAGEDQATGHPGQTPVQVIATQPLGTPAAVASPIEEDQMFAIRGSETVTAIIIDDVVYRYNTADDQVTTLPVGPGYQPWLADVSSGSEYLAVLVSPVDSLVQWKILVFDGSAELIHELPVVGGRASPVASSEVVATGTGGIDWSPDGMTIAVALPTGGLYAVGFDGIVEQMSPPRRVSRPGDLAWSPTGSAIAFANRPDSRSGLGLSLATTTAYPIDPVQLLRPDPTGNRSVRYVEWTPDGSEVIAIVDRKETGGVRGDVFSLETAGSQPRLIWSSGLHTMAGADAISVSPDGSLLAVLSSNDDGESIIILRQIGGPSEVQRLLEVAVENGVILWTNDGVVVAGEPATRPDGDSPAPVFIRIDESGSVEQIGPAGTPEASPQPVASPEATPVSSPVAGPDASPIGSPVAVPAASPVASPAGSPAASPATAEAAA
jgi:hypothetical protein